MVSRVFYSLATAVALVVELPGAAQPARMPPGSDPASLLARAREAMGFTRATDRVLHYRSASASEQNFQSDRTYPPFFSAMLQEEIWFDPATAVERIETQTQYPGSAPSPPAITLDDGRNAAAIRADQSAPVSRRQLTGRNLNPWAVIADWSSSRDIRIAGTEVYRDYPRVVLARQTPDGEEKLHLDAKTGFPVKLSAVEPHYLWGQRTVEYLWSTWISHDGVQLPGASFRVADGAIETSETAGAPELLTRDKAPSLAPPPPPADPPADLPRFLQAIAPTTKQVSASTWLLINPGYTEGVTRAGDEIFVFDATQSEDRARQDAEAIAKLFPGPQKITVVVTDLAWPHVGGVRYWVTRGATIVAHAAARGFLQRVVDRRWTLAPDLLEKQRAKDPKSVRLNFVAVQDTIRFAGGTVTVAPIDGIGSEVALMAFMPADKFLWASDYIQTLAEPTQYASEVISAAQRIGVAPERVAAQHLPLSEWNAVLAAQKAGR